MGMAQRRYWSIRALFLSYFAEKKEEDIDEEAKMKERLGTAVPSDGVWLAQRIPCQAMHCHAIQQFLILTRADS